ncbi:MAG: hypothetical protein JRE64_03255 [Deltaproteobacteria bacterium]|nr:hypothetical protein [Deltaproteobacteria bacterium]
MDKYKCDCDCGCKQLIVLTLLWTIGWLIINTTLAMADDFTITFEEPFIPVPGNVKSQYCNNPGTNKGVEFKFATSIFEPSVSTFSGTHALRDNPSGDDVDPFRGPMVFSFTIGQSHVGVRVGLDESHSYPVKAVLRAYDDPDPGMGTKLTPTPDPSVTLGNGPATISTPLTFSTPTGEPIIRRVEIEFMGPANEAAQEVIDDLTFSEIGSPCLIDFQAPSVQILQPISGETIMSSEVLLQFSVQDLVSGVARIRVSMLGPGNTELSSYFFCGGDEFPRTCPGFPSSLNVDAQYFTFLPEGTIGIRVEATDFAGNIGQDQISINLVLPDPTYNLWMLGLEITQGIQNEVTVSTQSRNNFAPEKIFGLSTEVPLIAQKRTVVRVYPGVEGTSNPVVGARATLRCLKSLGANLASSEPCGGPLGIEPVHPDITIDPANGNDINTLRLDPSLTWNFVLPSEWIEPGGVRYLVANIRAPNNLPECGSRFSGCNDGANFLIVRMVRDFNETAPLIIQPRFACVRRSSSVPRENCDAVASTAGDAMDVAQWFLWGRDWDNDGLLDPFFNTTYPLADGINGIEIRPPIINDFVDGDLSSPTGIMSGDRMGAYLGKIGDEFIFDFFEIFTDPGELIATAYPPNLRYLGFVPPPTGPSGKAYFDYPCAVVKIDLRPGRIGDGINAPENDFCSACPDDPRFTIHYDEPTVAHEIGHTFDIKHASCDHGEDDCDPAPSDFPCPHGGICLSAAQPDEPVGFNTYNMAVLPPRSGSSHAHDFMSYGPAPTWISPHTYGRIFNNLRSVLTSSSLSMLATPIVGHEEDESSSPQPVLFISGQIEQPGDRVTLRTVYQLPLEFIQKEGSGSYTLELQNADGQVLTHRRFDPIKVTDEEPGKSSHFFQLVAFSPDAARLVLKVDDVVLFERTRSPNAPTMNMVAPIGGEVWQVGSQTIRWEASDLDGDSLFYTVQYSKDNGKTWKTHAVNWPQTILEVDATLLAGSEPEQALIRVFASDGFNSVIAESAPFTVTDKHPHVRILAPTSGTVFSQQQLINFIGAAIDPEDGTLKDPMYSWSSHLDGNLGQGHELRLQTLSAGLHTITLTAQDSSGNTAQDTISIEVLGQPNTQPIADAGPNQTVFAGTLVELDGEASFDPDSDSLEFSWHFVSIPSGILSPPKLQDSISAIPSFITSVVGKYVLELVVRDGEVNSFPSQVVIEAVEGPTFQYVAKIICGEQKHTRDMRLAKGIYTTTVNIHNPHNLTTTFSKKLALTYPPGGQVTGKILPIGIDTLTADGALQTDCVDLQRRLFPNGFPTSYIEGFVIIESSVSLDVTAVYTSAKPRGWFSSPKVTSIDIEPVKEREIKKADQLSPDLIPVPVPGCSGNPTCFCDIRGDSLYVTVRNQGNARAGISMTEVDFGSFGKITVETPEIDPGDEKEVSFVIPAGCFNPDCEFNIKVDKNAQVEESDETNNLAEGRCIG